MLRNIGLAVGLLFNWLRTSAPVVGLARVLTWISELNTHHYPDDIRRRLKILNMIALLIAVTTVIYSFQHLFVDYDRFAPLIWVNLALVFVALSIPFAHSISPIAGGLVIVASEWIALALISALVGANSGVHLQYFIGCAAPFVVFGLERIRIVLVTVVSGITLHVFCWFQFPADAAWLDADAGMVNGIYSQAAITTGALIAASVWYAFQLAENAKAEVDRLLRNILPEPIVDRLKRRPHEPIADTYDEATVLFADISGFVALAKALGPQRVVRLLNDLVRSFDAFADRHGIEKIKTIGDAYMAVAGVPDPVPDPAYRMVAFADDVIREVERVSQRQGLDLAVRVGIASGPVLAGVIGTRKFSYDVWGDTVNLAARLEGQSRRGCIFVCPETARLLADDVALVAEGERDIRGGGALQIHSVGRETPAEAWPSTESLPTK
ncbi:MAG: adenylate/guanylate cyclase domain-containing protein [Pseudomonadota bacterium]